MLIPARIISRDATRWTKLRSLSTSRPQVSNAIDSQGRPPRGLARRALPHGDDGHDGRREFDDAQGDRGEGEVRRLARRGEVERDRDDDRPGDRAKDRHDAHQGTGQADLRGRDQVRDVALEGPLGRVGAELQQQVERADGDQRVGRGDADEEDQVQRRADHDVRLAPAPATRRVVADRAHHGLDEDGHQRPEAADDTHAGVHLLGREQQLQALRQDDRVEGREDHRQPEPVGRQLEELGHGQRGDGPSFGPRGDARCQDGCRLGRRVAHGRHRTGPGKAPRQGPISRCGPSRTGGRRRRRGPA